MVFICDTCYEEKGVAREASSVFLVDATYRADINPFAAIPMCEQHEGGFAGTYGKLSVLQAYAILDADTANPAKDALPPEGDDSFRRERAVASLQRALTRCCDPRGLSQPPGSQSRR